MSAQPAWAALPDVSLPAQPAPEQEPARRLRAVERPARRRRPKFVSALIAVLFAGLVAAAQMTLSIVTTNDAFALAELRSEQRELTLQAQSLEAQLTGLSSPQYLASNADALGMVVAGTPGYLRLSDAAVVGAGASASGLSTVQPTGSHAVRNALVADTPLVTQPQTTIHGAIPVAPSETSEAGAPVTDEPVSNLPPTLTEGLPSPTTH